MTPPEAGPLGPGAVPESAYRLRILVVRPDRLGDVVLSTPVFEIIKRHYGRSRLSVMVQEPVAPLVRGLGSVDDVMIFEPDGRHSGLRGFFRLLSDIRRKRFKIAVVLQSHWKIAFAILFARVQYRVGPLSKLHSFFTYNRGLRQHRSHVEMHEADYNLQLLRRIGVRVGTRNVPTRVALTDESKRDAKEWLRKEGWDGSTPIVAVHPGMGGSALNWPESHYVELIRALVRDGRQVLITGGKDEDDLLTRFSEALGAPSAPRARPIFFHASKLPEKGVDFLAGLYGLCDLVVAPSTGPLHVAVALGKPVVTFYPPIRVQSAIRWGPYVRDDGAASVLIPEMYCGEDFRCRGNLCNYFPCMRSLSVNQALEQANLLLARTSRRSDDGNTHG